MHELIDALSRCAQVPADRFRSVSQSQSSIRDALGLDPLRSARSSLLSNRFVWLMVGIAVASFAGVALIGLALALLSQLGPSPVEAAPPAPVAHVVAPGVEEPAPAPAPATVPAPPPAPVAAPQAAPAAKPKPPAARPKAPAPAPVPEAPDGYLGIPEDLR